MAAARPRGGVRRAVSLLHRWLGVAIGVAVAFVGLTGSLSVFHPEIDRLLNPGLHYVTPAADGRHATLDDIVATAMTAHPWGPPGFLSMRIPVDADRSAVVLMKDRFGQGSHPFHEAFVDPGTGRLLGHRAPEDRLVGWIIGLHAHLLLGDHGPGETAVGFFGIALVLFGLSGLFLWWPRRGQWRRALAVERRQGTWRLNYDLHRVTGAAMAVPLLAAALTGIVLVFPGYVRPPLKAVLDAPAPPRAPRSEPIAGAAPVGIDRAVAAARAAVIDSTPTAVQIPTQPTGAFQVRLRLPDDRKQHYADGSVLVHLDRWSGTVLRVARAGQRPVAGRVLHEWILPTHTGEIAGLAGRILMCLAGLAPAGLFATGLWMWLRRRRARRVRRAARATAGGVA
ncbi:MAG: PepSY-associated TM helix domain-containing protein [Alphaproteobacteria bacterium]